MVHDLGRDIRGVRRAPVVVEEVDRGGGSARGDDPASALLKSLPMILMRGSTVDRETSEKIVGVQSVGRAGIQSHIPNAERPTRGDELAAGVDGDVGVVRWCRRSWWS